MKDAEAFRENGRGRSKKKKKLNDSGKKSFFDIPDVHKRKVDLRPSKRILPADLAFISSFAGGRPEHWGDQGVGPNTYAAELKENQMLQDE